MLAAALQGEWHSRAQLPPKKNHQAVVIKNFLEVKRHAGTQSKSRALGCCPSTITKHAFAAVSQKVRCFMGQRSSVPSHNFEFQSGVAS